MGVFASIDGKVVPGEEARVSAFDNGFAFGDSVYETLRTYGGRPFVLGRHLARLRRSAGRLGFEIPQPDAELRGRVGAVLAAAKNPESYFRMIVSRGVGDLSYNFERVKGPTVVILVKPWEPYPAEHFSAGIPVSLVSIRRNPKRCVDPAIKTSNLLNNVLATLEAQKKGGFEAILLNERDEIAEGAGSNVFVGKGGVLKTPPLDAGILAGITRDLVFELGRKLGVDIREQPLHADDLLSADEAFITSTLKEVTPISRVDDRVIGAGKPGALTLRLQAAYREKTRAHED
jgi:branched-chain amino acid aminotransferase